MLTMVKSALLNMSCDTMFPFISEALKLPKEAAKLLVLQKVKNMENKNNKFLFQINHPFICTISTLAHNEKEGKYKLL